MAFLRDEVRVAVITGRHPFEVPPFVNLFRDLRGIDFYLQDLQNFAEDLADVKDDYDVLLFYNMHPEPPNDASRAVLEALGKTEQGIFLLHHGILAFRGWQLWSDISGIQDRRFTYHPGEMVHIEIADPEHPITKGLSGWQMIDETYVMESAGEGSRILLTTDHPKSLNTIAWTRRYGKSPVFCLASGHGKETYADPSFRTVVERGILWLAGRA